MTANPADLVSGTRFRLYRETATPGTYEYLAIAMTLGLTRANAFEDATAPDLTDPYATPVRQSALRSTSWDISCSGQADAKSVEKMESDYESSSPHNYRIMLDKTAAAGGQSYQGAVWFESLELGKSNQGFVTFTAKMRGDGVLARVAASA